MEILLSKIDAGRFEHPYTWGTYKHLDGRSETALYQRPGPVMDHLSREPHLRAKFHSEPIKTSKVFKQQLLASGVVLADEMDRTIRGKRTAHLVSIGLEKLERLGLYAAPIVA